MWISDVSNNYQDIVITMREVLRHVAEMYDPLGFIVPITFHGKVFLQSLWKHDLTWDEQLPETLCQEFSKLLMLLQEVQPSKYPDLLEHLIKTQCFKCWCFVILQQSRMVLQCIYVLSHLVASLPICKMRLTPAVSKKKRKGREVDEISLPRLELLGVLMGVRASNSVSRELKLPDKKGTFVQILSVFYTGLEQPSCYQYLLRTELRKLKEKQI